MKIFSLQLDALEKLKESELRELNDEEILNNPAARSFLHGLVEQDRISPQIGEAELEGDTLLIHQLRYARIGR